MASHNCSNRSSILSTRPRINRQIFLMVAIRSGNVVSSVLINFHFITECTSSKGNHILHYLSACILIVDPPPSASAPQTFLDLGGPIMHLLASRHLLETRTLDEDEGTEKPITQEVRIPSNAPLSTSPPDWQALEAQIAALRVEHSSSMAELRQSLTDLREEHRRSIEEIREAHHRYMASLEEFFSCHFPSHS
ncbi:hypothetical protein CJ030_MR4G020926 [Morella rubra]|uniref:Uncharacterized protein n=1 Tax=Morella rubra TaxID=262757 RepID=A0A6A1VXA1_9ROSI|nr:hypothetical protein CJ030_MR4G020926 [Morella rubra]